VHGSPPGGVIHQWGFFLASDLWARVLLAASGCPSGWGVWPLLWFKLAALWDVPILVSYSMSKESNILILQGFCASAPAKVLFAGADALLTTLFRGDAVVNSSNEVVILTKEAKVVGPSPRSNEDLGLVVSSCKDRHDRHDKRGRFVARVVKGDA
jgi:hypothetical protein